MKKILVSDYDRTFYLNKEGIKKNIEAVEKFRKNGNLFVIATGRSFLDFKKKQYKYHFDYDYVILNHGATILDRKGHILDNNVINNEVVLDIKKDVQDIKTKKQFCCSAKESRVDFLFGNITKIYLEYESQNITTMVNEMINNKLDNNYKITPSKQDLYAPVRICDINFFNEQVKLKRIKILSSIISSFYYLLIIH